MFTNKEEDMEEKNLVVTDFISFFKGDDFYLGMDVSPVVSLDRDNIEESLAKILSSTAISMMIVKDIKSLDVKRFMKEFYNWFQSHYEDISDLRKIFDLGDYINSLGDFDDEKKKELVSSLIKGTSWENIIDVEELL